MCDTGNLIDLSAEEETNALYTEKTDLNTCQHPSTSTTLNEFQVNNNPQTAYFIDAPLVGRVSLDNNPFDRIQKLANRQDDPFEIVEKEACFKARQSLLPNYEVKLGNLLSLSDDNLLDMDDDKYKSKTQNTPFEMHPASTVILQRNTEVNMAIDDSNSSPLVRLDKQDYVGTPASIDSALSGDSSDGCGSTGSIGSKNKKLTEYRKKLLKLSLSNSTFNSPVSRRLVTDCQNMQENDGNNFSPISAMFAEAAQMGEHMLAAESPLKFVDDDLLSEEPVNFIESERNFEADLEMLKIPILDELPSPPHLSTSGELHNKHLDTENKDLKAETKPFVGATVNAGLTTLEAIRAKLHAKKLEANNNNDVSQLLQSLKSLICDINAVDAEKKHQANNLLETLSKALSSKSTDDVPNTSNTLVPPTPPVIVRQGTFDLDLQEKGVGKAVDGNDVETQNAMMPNAIPVSELPDCMFGSSATYDGETADEQREYVLPEVDPISPAHVTRPVTPVETDVNEIVEQLAKLLQQQQQAQESNADGSASNTTINPTFIVVMNSSTVGQLPNMKKRNSLAAGALENSLSDGSPDLKNISNMQRRRSQSLSIHDKIKIVKFPLNAEPEESVQADHSPTLAQKVPTIDVADFKTPARFLPRRNSFSSGMSCTTNLTLSARRAAELAARVTPQQRRSAVMEAQNEKQRQHQAIVRPLPPMPNKRKVGQHTESIMKSSAPLKATIPFKKITPQLKASPPTPELPSNNQTDAAFGNKSALNSSIQMLGKNSRIALTSTPMPYARSASTIGATRTPMFPNVDATPNVQITPMKRNTYSLNPDGHGTLSKSRYSFSTTPSAKTLPVPSAAAAGLKRRTLTELKAKSPVKPRVSRLGTNMASTTTSAKTTTSRLTTKSTQSRVSTVTNRSISRVSSSRLSTTGTFRNKENKQP